METKTVNLSVNSFYIPANCNKSNPSSAYPAFKALSLWLFEEEVGGFAECHRRFDEFQRRERLAYAALEEFFTDVLNEDVEEMASIYDSYIEDNNLWELYDKLGGDGGMDDFTGFDQFMLFHKPNCWMREDE